jgi:sporulation protein YlmC with PRC-barrel domain
MIVEHLRRRAVVSLQQAEKLGSIEDVLVDSRNHRLAGVMLRNGLFDGGSTNAWNNIRAMFFGGGATIAWSNIRTIGLDAVMVDVQSAGDNFVPDGVISLGNLRGRKVVTDDGVLAGTIDSLDFNTENGTVNHYIVAGLSSGRFRMVPHYQFPPAAIRVIGDDIITVDADGMDFQHTENPS